LPSRQPEETNMRLIGMLDSPYVRRTAIALRLLEIPFEHDPLSVFSTFEQFSRVNPVVKAPSLVCDDGTVLMDSGLIIDYAETLAGRSLWPVELAARTRLALEGPCIDPHMPRIQTQLAILQA